VSFYLIVLKNITFSKYTIRLVTLQLSYKQVNSFFEVLLFIISFLKNAFQNCILVFWKNV